MPFIRQLVGILPGLHRLLLLIVVLPRFGIDLISMIMQPIMGLILKVLVG